MIQKLKALPKRIKAVAAAALVAVVSAMTTVAASAETVEATNNMETMMKSAGDQIIEQFTSLIGTIVPVIIGILGSGLIIFGIMALIRLTKKTFNKVTG